MRGWIGVAVACPSTSMGTVGDSVPKRRVHAPVRVMRYPQPGAHRVPWRRIALGLAAAAAAVLSAAPAGAGDSLPYPSRPIRLVVPFAPGGGADNLARTLHSALNDAIGQTFVIDNRGGGGGTIGTELVAKAPSDGHTLALVTTGHTVNPALFAKVPYDAIGDFAPVSLLASQPNVLVVHPTVAAKSVKELVGLARAKPGSLNFASGGNGSSPHLSGELLKLATGADIRHIPYKGAGPGIADLVAGHVQMMFVGPISIESYVRAGRLRALAVADARRLSMLPDVPTMAEAGFGGIETGTWYALLAPAGTPRPVVVRLNEAFARVLRAPEMTARLNRQGMDVLASSPEELLAFMKSELAKWSKVVKAAKLRVD